METNVVACNDPSQTLLLETEGLGRKVHCFPWNDGCYLDGPLELCDSLTIWESKEAEAEVLSQGFSAVSVNQESLIGTWKLSLEF